MRTSRSNSFHTRRSPSSIFHHFNYLGIYTLFQENTAVQALLTGMRAGVGAVIVSVVWDMGSGIVRQKKISSNFHHVLRVHRQLLL